jgi:hypothetical protein
MKVLVTLKNIAPVGLQNEAGTGPRNRTKDNLPTCKGLHLTGCYTAPCIYASLFS